MTGNEHNHILHGPRTLSWHRRVWNLLTERPAYLFVTSFASAILVGAGLLALPVACSQGRLSLIDALFTSTSAVCVTGLIVVDTGSVLSTFGEVVLLLLIQMGGLGVMTITTFLALVIGGDLGLRGEFAIREMVREERCRSAIRLLRFIVLVTLLIEGVGFLCLWPAYISAGTNAGRAAYLALFHSVSAFCNAGFSLHSDSLCGFADTPAIPLVVSALVILGGLGFGVLYSSYAVLRHGRRNSFHATQVLWCTLALVALGTALLAGIEAIPGAGGHGLSLLDAFFQSVTARTAGFNTVDIATLSTPSQEVLMGLMFIGAAPGSTGGGVKVTTLLVLIAVVATVIRGRDDVVLARRRLAFETISQAMALVLLGALLIAGAFLLLLISETASPRVLLFETVSAFGTVGLSLGATAHLSVPGKLVIVAVMFAGRVGILTFLLLLRPRRRSRLRHPLAELVVG